MYIFLQILNISCVFLTFATYFMKSLQNRVVSDPKKIKAKRKNQQSSQNSEVVLILPLIIYNKLKYVFIINKIDCKNGIVYFKIFWIYI